MKKKTADLEKTTTDLTNTTNNLDKRTKSINIKTRLLENKTTKLEKELEEQKREIQNEISSLNYYNANVENSIKDIKNNSSYEKRAKINLLFHEIIKSISIDLVEKYSVITFKNDITRIIDKDGFVINVDRVNKLEIDFTTIQLNSTWKFYSPKLDEILSPCLS